ncbi:uncharacterized protein FPRO_02202 [Fusarium proliferatum ET1]|uniref:asparaginase n=1 Tax=Fusarium proliferatum (strain ET1) TaxID=1227346 RepID=A0A1L7V9U5_FUSPR|nr:uncharacterized protein FPRO_02202 [Fusarium proliferatum ET1]CZR37537.1 uncharacterized protein FPRO_02202 [Fusarium proliferatum ET1]
MGNIPGGAEGRLTQIIKAAVERGIVVVNISQCVNGFVFPICNEIVNDYCP